MRILLCLVLLSSTCFASVDLNIFSKNVKLPEPCKLFVDASVVLSIYCNNDHSISFASSQDGDNDAKLFLKKAQTENMHDIKYVDHTFTSGQGYKHYYTHYTSYGTEEFTYILCDNNVCTFIDSTNQEFITEVLSQLKITPLWKS
jgi:hypothetical protein